ncbi:hypothetical protein SprV_0301036000 [Sparganum proliferum]
MMRQLYDGMMVRVTDSGAVAETLAVTNGVKQGCFLSLNLSSLMFSAMLMDAYRDECLGICIAYRTDGHPLSHRLMHFQSRVSTTTGHEILFADNCALNTTSKEDMQRHMDFYSAACGDFSLVVFARACLRYLPDMENSDTTLKSVLARLNEYNARTLFVGHIPRAFTLKQLMALFKKSVNARFSIGRATGSSKFGFVEFKSTSEAKRAKDASESLTVAGKPVKVEICSERIAERGSDGDGSWCLPQNRTLNDFNLTTLHVSCLPRDTKLTDISPLFPKSLKTTLSSEGPNRCLGRAIVSFATPEDALEAFNSAHGQSVHKCPIVVNFKLRKIKKRKTASKTAAGPTASTVSTNGVTTSTATAMPKPADTGVTLGTPKSWKKKKRSKKHASQTGTPLEVSVPTANGESASPAATKPDPAVSTPSTNPKLEKSALATGTPVTKKRKRPLPLSSPTDALPPKAARKSARSEDASPSLLTPATLPRLPPCESSAWEDIAEGPDHLYKV